MMTKRKRDTTNEEPFTPQQSKKVKKQISTTKAPHAKAPSNPAPTYTEIEGSTQAHESQEREKEGGQILTTEHKSKKKKGKDKTVRQNGKKSKGKTVETATWKVSDSVGGQMLDVDPVFSPDEK